MRATILPYAIGILPLMCFLFSLPNYIHVYPIIMQYNWKYNLDATEVLQQEYS